MRWPVLKMPWSISFASFINALSIPLIAFLLWWILDRVTDPKAYCPALEEFKLPANVQAVQWRCQPILMAQLDIAKYVAIGLVAALSLSHLVSVIREAKAAFELDTKVKVGGEDEKKAANHVKDEVEAAADQAVADVTGEPLP
jgi:hypothetical protein